MFDQIFGLLFQPFQQFQFLHLLVCCWPPPPLCKNNISTGFNTFSNFSLKLICHLSYFQRQLLADNRYLILIDHPKNYTCFSLHNFFRLNSNWTNFWFYHSILLIFVRTNETIFVGPVKNVQTENERWMFPFATQHTS